MAIFIIARGHQQGRRVNVQTWPISIGREQSNSVAVDDDQVSRHHVRIKSRGRTSVIEDLDSRNGTFLNGERIINATIKNGDRILVGNTEILFFADETQIELATDVLGLDHVLSDDLKLPGPLNVDLDSANISQHKRLEIVSQLEHYQPSPETLRTIFEIHSNTISASNLEDTGQVLLKGLGKFLNDAQQAAMFLWEENTARLTPFAMHVYGNSKKQPFHLSKRIFEDVISRKQGALIQPNDLSVTQSGPQRLVLPMMHESRMMAVVHIEFSNRAQVPNSDVIEAMQMTLVRASSCFEVHLLRKEVDAYTIGFVESMVATLEAKDTYTHGHSERVSKYALAIADELKLNRGLKKLLLMSSLCHDIGKVGIPDAILRKASLLSVDEYEEMKNHPVIGARIVAQIPNAKRFISGIKYHHEKWDGSGYPDGLVGEQIPFFGRIIGVADAFDAMISGRSYSGFMSEEKAVEELSQEKGLFDPDVIKAFSKAFDNGRVTQRTSTRTHNPAAADPDDAA